MDCALRALALETARHVLGPERRSLSRVENALRFAVDDCPLPNGGQPVAGGQGPGAIKAPMDTAIIPKPKGVEQTRTEIWDEDDVAADDGLQIDPSDTRLRPEYDILYKQDVSANVRGRPFASTARPPRL